ncbi:MAG: M13 family metallopeptidase N-terminal domain-containing protein, partial [Allosphingosinicella sp.]
MIKHIALCGVAALGLAAASVPARSADPHARHPAAKPQFGDWGFDVAGMDRSVNPGDNFFDFANGRWAATTEIPADKPVWGGFVELADLSTQRTRTIIEDAAKANAPAGTVQRKVGDFYASFMDEAAIEARGTAPLKPGLERIAAIRTPSDLAAAFGALGQTGVRTPFGVQVEQDLKDNSVYSVYVGQGGLGLPDRDYYLDAANPKFAEAKAKYKIYIANMLRLAGIPDGEARAERIVALETKIAQAHWTRVQSRQIESLYNPMTKAELSTKMPGFDWNAYLAAAGLGSVDRVIVAQPSALTGAAKLVASEPIG